MSCTLSAESYLQNCRQELKTKKTVAIEVSGCFGHTVSIYATCSYKKERKKKRKKEKKKKERRKKERKKEEEQGKQSDSSYQPICF